MIFAFLALLPLAGVAQIPTSPPLVSHPVHSAWSPGDTAYVTPGDPAHGYIIGQQVRILAVSGHPSEHRWYVEDTHGRRFSILESALGREPAQPIPAKPPNKVLPTPMPPSKVVPLAVAPAFHAVPVTELRSNPTAYYGPGGIATDQYSFGVWLNGYRASCGLPPLSYSPAIAADCVENSRHGFGHIFRGRCRRQNVGVGDMRSICNAWAADPPHQAALLDPAARSYGIALVGSVWTYGCD